MKTIWRLMWVYILLTTRVPLALFFNLVLPLVFFGFYSATMSHASSAGVSGLMVRLVTLGALSNGLFGLSINLAAMRERDILRRYHLAPISAFHIIVSRLLANYLMFFAVILVELSIAKLVFALDLRGVLPAILFIFSIGYLAIAGIGFMISSISNTVTDAQIYNQAAFFALLFLSGIAMPLASLPRFLQHMAAFVPPALMIVSADSVLKFRTSHGLPWAELLCLVMIATVMIVLATVMFRWEKEMKVGGRDRLMAALVLVPLIAMGLWLNASQGFQRMLSVTSEDSSTHLSTAPSPGVPSATATLPR